ncbi:MAG: beta-N-acetylhexosaminidase [Treponema sp.]|nr:beta-N-acetylhexosaminidase [Treponema sp.]MCL2272246.1 beta-N-acetylhexosaminidase [Treponema sp.]
MKELSIIPKPVSINYSDGEFCSDGMPLLNKRNIKLDGQEAYRLIIKKDGITVEASSETGMFRGEQTFRQLMLSEFKDGKLILPCAEINDYPRFPWRGFMLDCSRYFYSVPFIEKIIDVLSIHHINRFHWHLTDDQGWRFPVPEYPLLNEIGARRQDRRFPWASYKSEFYSEDDIRRIVNYAARRHMEIIPEVDLPGHASAILACYPGLGCTGGPYRVEDRFGIFEDVLCAGNDQIFDFFNAVFDTLVRLFPSKWVHIGGDEVLFNRWQECPKCRKKLESLELEKPADLQSWITCSLVKMLMQRSRIAIGWDEILEDTPKYKLPDEAVIMSWRGEEGGIKASGLGHQVIMTPNTHGCYLDYKHLPEPEETGRTLGLSTIEMGYSMNPVTAQMKEPSLILGGQGNLWSEVIYAGKIAEYMIFPRMCAIAENLWTPFENKNLGDFSKRLDVHRHRLDKLGINQYRGPLK